MLERTARRLTGLAVLLQGGGLLPQGPLSSEEERHRFFLNLDRTLSLALPAGQDPAMLPYRLRARALDEGLQAYEIGRALYHLGQRRGFLSNRRAPSKKHEESEVKEGIAELAREMEAAGARTLGEYFSGLDLHHARIRHRWTSRQMYLDEFDKIWETQAQYQPGLLTNEFRRQVHRAIFYQRPVRSASHLIGHCDLEPGRKRAAWALLPAQRFRLLQKVNDLELATPDGVRRRLTGPEREALVAHLETKGDITFPRLRGLLSLDKRTGFKLAESEDRVIGNRTAARLMRVLGESRWEGLSSEDRERIVEDLGSIQKEEALARRVRRVWGLDEEKARELASTRLEEGYCNLSRKAIERLLPLLEQGVAYATARKQVYGDAPPRAAYDEVPPFDLPRRLGRLSMPEVRNPAVKRALNEARRVVNAVIQEHGKPDIIRIEFARELKKARKERKAISERNRANRKAREEAASRLLQEAGIQPATRRDIEKWLLAEECRWECPYTGKQMSAGSLFGEAPQFDIEHIIPLYRCWDDSFFNKTLCEVNENRNVKANRSPWEAYGSDSERWDEIIRRVKSYRGAAAKAKLERFKMTDLVSLDDFAGAQLNATGYASRLARECFGVLYGAGADGVDPRGKVRVQVTRGGVTRYLRDEWGLNAMLGGAEKRREDHRQHAVDAILVALTDQRAIKALSDAAERARSVRRRRFAPIEAPWRSFVEDVGQALETLIVSHRVSRKVSGPLHDETYYSRPRADMEGEERVRVRKPLNGDFKDRDVEAIVDPAVRERVREHLERHAGDARKAFGDAADLPFLEAKDGRRMPIRKARIYKALRTQAIAEGARRREVATGSNHHVEILEVRNKKGAVKWEGEVVTMLEAMRRLRAGEPVVRRDHGPEKRFLFSLCGGDTIELDSEGSRQLYVVRSTSPAGGGRYVLVEFVRNNEARNVGHIKKGGEWSKALLDPLRERNCRKVVVSPLGEVRAAND
jgi:CRISPR-associated endonuclease Csn1